MMKPARACVCPGPFKTVKTNVKMPGAGRIADMDLFMDDDGVAYQVRTSFTVVQVRGKPPPSSSSNSPSPAPSSSSSSSSLLCHALLPGLAMLLSSKFQLEGRRPDEAHLAHTLSLAAAGEHMAVGC